MVIAGQARPVNDPKEDAQVRRLVGAKYRASEGDLNEWLNSALPVAVDLVKAGVLASRFGTGRPALVKRTPKNKIYECRQTNADQTAPGSGDPNSDEQTPLTERRWAIRQ
jgi:hypothetical protein